MTQSTTSCPEELFSAYLSRPVGRSLKPTPVSPLQSRVWVEGKDGTERDEPYPIKTLSLSPSQTTAWGNHRESCWIFHSVTLNYTGARTSLKEV